MITEDWILEETCEYMVYEDSAYVINMIVGEMDVGVICSMLFTGC